MVTKKITLNNPERFSKVHEIPREKLLLAAERACAKLEANAKKYGLGFPGTCSVEHKYVRDVNKNWECGMYTGCFWLAYELTGNEYFRQCAEEQLPTYRWRIEEKVGMNDHDVGFVFTPSCVAGYKVTGNEDAKKMALDAFEYYYPLSYSKEGKFIIRSYNMYKVRNNPAGYRTMMDALMNAPLFFWAAEVTGNEEFKTAALDHNKTVAKYLIRDDASSYHHYQFDMETSAPLHGVTLQGNSNESCWSRGHSWGVYGFPIAYSYTGEKFLVDVHKDITYFMLNHLPEDNIPYWDYDFTSGDECRDTSAGAISVCGMNEMCRHLPDDAEQKKVFESAAAQILESIIDNYTGDIGVEYDGLIHHVTHAKPQGQGFDECAVYGDYFYLEALLRYLKPDWKKYW